MCDKAFESGQNTLRCRRRNWRLVGGRGRRLIGTGLRAPQQAPFPSFLAYAESIPPSILSCQRTVTGGASTELRPATAAAKAKAKAMTPTATDGGTGRKRGSALRDMNPNSAVSRADTDTEGNIFMSQGPPHTYRFPLSI